MTAKIAQHPLMFAAMLIVAATGAMGFAAIPASTQPTLAYELTPQITADDRVVDDGIDKVLFKEAIATSANGKIDRQLECMAKVVHHEAGNQPRSGQLAVAQLVMNRVGQDRFGASVCEVVNQRGQFFQTSAYNPRRDTAQWASSLEIARSALDGTAPQVVPGAVFFHATYIAPNSWFRSRQRVATLGQHIFYR